MSSSAIPPASLEERQFAQESADKKCELDLREREVKAKEHELGRSRWLNPTVLGLFAATIGLIGSVVVARVNNSNTQQVERLRSQSTLVLEAIRTGNTDDACKNLMFFVSLKLLDDSNQIILKQCGSMPAGAPSLPVPQRPELHTSEGLLLTGFVYDSKSQARIPGAVVSLPDAGVSCVTTERGDYVLPLTVSGAIFIRAEKQGYKTWEARAMPIPGWNIGLEKK
jgi:hypothetical protein